MTILVEPLRVESIRHTREHLAEVVDLATFSQTPTIIARRGKPVAAVVSIDMLQRLTELEEREIVQILDQRMTSTTPGIPLEEVLAETLAADA